MQKISYQKLEEQHLDTFIAMRMTQLQEEGADPAFDLAPALRDYYRRHMKDHTFLSWLALDEHKIIATSGISFVEKPPYYSNPAGKIGLLSSMYTLKQYRRQGIAKSLLDKIIADARTYGCSVIQITASDMGIPFYTKYGFAENNNFMQYLIK